MDYHLPDSRLTLEAQFKLRVVEDQSQDLSTDQLRHCLLMAWEGWLLERQLLLQTLNTYGIEVMVRPKGYTPAELCGVES